MSVIKIISIRYPLVTSCPEVVFEQYGVEFCAELDPGVRIPVVVHGTAEDLNGGEKFENYFALQNAINEHERATGNRSY